MPNIGPWEIAIVVILVLLIFGPKKLPELGSSLGKSIRGFKKGLKDNKDEIASTVAEVREATAMDDIKSAVKEVRQASGVDEVKATVAEIRQATNVKGVLSGSGATTAAAAPTAPKETTQATAQSGETTASTGPAEPTE